MGLGVEKKRGSCVWCLFERNDRLTALHAATCSSVNQKTWPSKILKHKFSSLSARQVINEELGMMSLPRPTVSEATATSSSSSWNKDTLLSYHNSKREESDEDLLTVPDVETRPPASSSVNPTTNYNNATLNNNPEVQNQPEKRRRGRNPVDKEYRRLKRLLRNRVSAQQARERKKVYVNDLESRAQELQDNNSKLEEKISTLTNENAMLRKVLMNTRPKVDRSIEVKQDHA